MGKHMVDGGDAIAMKRRDAALLPRLWSEIGYDFFEARVADQVGTPTYVGDLVGALLEAAEGTISEPVLHAANAGETSRFEQARAVFELVGADPERVRPVDSDRHPRPAPRPQYSALSAVRSTEAGLTPLRPWRDALASAI